MLEWKKKLEWQAKKATKLFLWKKEQYFNHDSNFLSLSLSLFLLFVVLFRSNIFMHACKTRFIMPKSHKNENKFLRNGSRSGRISYRINVMLNCLEMVTDSMNVYIELGWCYKNTQFVCNRPTPCGGQHRSLFCSSTKLIFIQTMPKEFYVHI